LSTKLYGSDSDEDARIETASWIEGAEAVANVLAKFGTKTTEKAFEKSLIGSAETITREIEEYTEDGVYLFVPTCFAPQSEFVYRNDEEIQQGSRPNILGESLVNRLRQDCDATLAQVVSKLRITSCRNDCA
jgi:hypothetical protein